MGSRLPPRSSWASALTVLSTQATERPAKRLATPRATLTSSLRMSSHRLFRNLNNLSVYVATPGERRQGWLEDSGQDTGSLWFCPLTFATRRRGRRYLVVKGREALCGQSSFLFPVVSLTLAGPRGEAQAEGDSDYEPEIWKQ